MDSWLERYYHPLVGYTISDITLTPDDEGDQWATLTLTKGAKTIKEEAAMRVWIVGTGLYGQILRLRWWLRLSAAERYQHSTLMSAEWIKRA